MTSAKLKEILRRLKKAYPGAKIALRYSNPLELLVATVLSAQCTDERVNQVTAGLFRQYRRVEDYATANLQGLEQDIRPTGFFRNKARNLVGAAKMMLEDFDGQVPQTMEELVRLPGVARKTANIVLYNGYGMVEGIPVDTHVRRVAARLGLTQNTDPDKIERDLMTALPRSEWGPFSYLLIDHGRALCTALKPKCAPCFLNDLCPSAFKV